MLTVSTPTFGQHHDGFGINCDRPNISWRFLCKDHGGIRNWRQTAYDIQIEEEVYHVGSSESAHVPWPAASLQSRSRADVRVRCHGTYDADSGLESCITPWSSWSKVETGLLDKTDWYGSMIATPTSLRAEDGSLRPVRFQTSFELADSVVDVARVYVTAYGVYEATLNGHRVGDHHMAPGWTSYHHRMHYQIFDISPYLKIGARNIISFEVGAGWYASALGWCNGRRFRYGDRLAVLAQLEISSGDHLTKICTDDSWQCHDSYITKSELYNGETCDMRLRQDSVSASTEPSSAHEHHRVALLPFPVAVLRAPDAPPVRVIETVSPIAIFTSGKGKTIIDFGQNLVGKLRVRHLKKPAGSVVTFQHAEVMENNGLGVRPLRTARNEDVIICSGNDIKDWSPKFTFHGFRYVQVDGWTAQDDTPLELTSLVADVLHTDMKRLGHFKCSHPLLNKLHLNAVWSMRGNFLSLPTDCPQRDERLGWTGDIAAFAPSAGFLYNVSGMLGHWLEDLSAEQHEPDRNGVPPLVVPSAIEKDYADEPIWWPRVPQAIWGDAAILVPWALYHASGDRTVLERQLESMKLWLGHGIPRGQDGLWDEDIWQLGDWLDPNASPHDPGEYVYRLALYIHLLNLISGRTDGTLVADAYLVHVTQLMSYISKIVSPSDEAGFHSTFQQLKSAFQHKYVTNSGLIAGDTQTALTLAIRFNLLDEPSQREAAGKRLVRHVKKSQFKIATGFAGTPNICHALTKTNHSQHAYRLVLNKALPSWIYQIEQGATTIWERWDSMLSDGSINPGEMTSFNHYALGSVIQWFHECIGGLTPLQPGWKNFQVRPVPGGSVTSAKTSFESPYGYILCEWKIVGDRFEMKLIVPPNSSAKVMLPGQTCSDDTPEMVEKGEQVSVVWVGSGSYDFACEYGVSEAWPPQAILPPFWGQSQPEHV